MSGPADLSFLTKEEHMLVDGVLERHRVSSSFDRPFKDRALKSWRYRNNQLPMPWPFWSQIFEPEPSTVLTETVEAIMSGLFQKENFFDLRATQPIDEAKKEKAKELMAFALRRQEYAYKLKKYRQTQECVAYGNGVVFHYVEPTVYESRSVERVVDEFGVAVGLGERVSRRLEFWPMETPLSRFDLYPAPTGADIQAMPYFQHTALVPLSWLQAMPGRFKNVDRLNGFLSLDRNGRAGVEDEELAFDLYERLRAVGFDVREGLESGGGRNGSVEYCELLYETVAPPTGTGCARWRVIGNRSVVLLDEEYPFWLKRKPYSEIKYLERSGNIWAGAGLLELIEPLVDKLNIRSNMISDALLLNSHPMTLLKQGTLVSGDKTELMHWPDRVIDVVDLEGVRTLERPHVGQDLFADLDLSRAGIQRIAKLFDATRGISGMRTGMGKGTDTATGMTILAQMMNASVNFKMLWMDETGFTDGLRITLACLQQLTTRETQIRVLDDTNPVLIESGDLQNGFLTVGPEDVQGEYDIIPVGSIRALEDPQLAEQQRLWLTTARELPEVAPRIKQMEAWLAQGELLRIPSPRRFVRTDREQQEWEAQSLSKMLAQQQVSQVLQRAMSSLSNVPSSSPELATPMGQPVGTRVAVGG